MITSHLGPVVGTHANLTAIQCSRCGFIHLDPIPTLDPYSSGYYHRNVKPDYRKEYDEDSEWWSAVYSDWISLVEKYGGGGAFLDAGAGTGHFVEAVEMLGYQVNGLEPDPNMAAHSNLIWNCGYSDLDSDDEKQHWTWGAISSHWVMEHLPDPVDFLQWAHRRLADDGLLLVTIPNDFTKLQAQVVQNTKSGYYWLNEHHINYWNRDSFSSLLAKNGYRIVTIYGSWEPELHLLAGRDYLHDHALGRRVHRSRMLDDLKMTQEERIEKYLKLGNEGRGRDLTFLARKI